MMGDKNTSVQQSSPANSNTCPVKIALTPPHPQDPTANDIVPVSTSTPIKWPSTEALSRSLSTSSSSSSTTGTIYSSSDPEQSNPKELALAVPGGPGSLAILYDTPVVGYEVMEERTRFTVFKIWVESKDSGDGWFVFRRYTDFLRLNRKLRASYPGLRLVLPPKKWFGDNFDPAFLDDRLFGLQAYVINITNHPDISQEKIVKDFFCVDSKPEPHDSIEESRAMCQSLDQKVHILKRKLKEKDAEIHRLNAELALMKTQQETLVKGLKLECSVTAFTQSHTTSSPRQSSSSSPHYDHNHKNINNILGIHNVNVTLLHMMESSTSQHFAKDSTFNDCYQTVNADVHNSSSSPNVKQLQLPSNDNAKSITNNKLYPICDELDSPTSSDSGYTEELLAANNNIKKKCLPLVQNVV